ncbi:MAG: hypothetical protein KDA77_11505, partial [Planctomycetaceae bacterium]|nr:hypothetical protein [Planctomycetaceae bacterium]
MLSLLKRACLISLFLLGVTLLQAEEPTSVKNGWASRPEGKYKFLQMPYETGQAEAIRKSLPFRRIKLERRAPGGYSFATGKGFPAVIYYIEFHADGTALLHATSGIEKNGIYKGKIALTDYP